MSRMFDHEKFEVYRAALALLDCPEPVQQKLPKDRDYDYDYDSRVGQAGHSVESEMRTHCVFARTEAGAKRLHGGGLGQGVHETPAIRVVPEDGLPAVAAIEDLMASPRILDSQPSGLALEGASAGANQAPAAERARKRLSFRPGPALMMFRTAE